MDQHVISGWLLRAFARGGQDPRMLAVYDKTDDTVTAVPPETFMVELDAHSSQVERGIGRIEGPASQAARALVKRLRPLPAGLYAVVAEGGEVRDDGPDLRDMGTFEDIKLMVGASFRRPSGLPVQGGDSGGPLWFKYSSTAGIRGIVSLRSYDAIEGWNSYATQYATIADYYRGVAIIP